MKKDTALLQQQAIRQEASAWIARLDGKEPSQQELAAFRAWISQSPAHRNEVQKLAKLWGELNILTELAVPHESPVRAKGSSMPKEQVQRRYIMAARLVIAAASVILAVGVLFDMSQAGQLPSYREDAYVTDIGEQKLITLDDGSTMLLNTASRAEVDYAADQRIVKLIRGQAYFDVQKDTARPFFVTTEKGVVRAVGTAFSVYLKSDGVDVIVTEGTVEINVANGSNKDVAALAESGEVAHDAGQTIKTTALVRAGQKAIADGVIESIETIEAGRLEKEQSWRQGVLKFSGEPLEKVVAEISRYTSQTILIKDEKLRALRFGGMFEIGETNKLFVALEAGFGVHVERVNDSLVVLSSNTL